MRKYVFGMIARLYSRVVPRGEEKEEKNKRIRETTQYDKFTKLKSDNICALTL